MVHSVLPPGSIDLAEALKAVACVKLIPSMQFIIAQTVRDLCIVECDRPATNAVAKPELCKRRPTFDRRQQFSASGGSVHSQGHCIWTGRPHSAGDSVFVGASGGQAVSRVTVLAMTRGKSGDLQFNFGIEEILTGQNFPCQFA